MTRSARGLLPAIALLFLLILSGCGRGKENQGVFPKDFNQLNDEAKMEFMMANVTPDSVARFICDASLGRIEGVQIDTLSMAALYAYEHYKDDDLQSFQSAFDSYADNLPLAEKMKLRMLAASDNPDALGYQLGLEYVNDIRLGSKTTAQVETEIDALRKACDALPGDTMTFKRFMTGFKVALDQDGANGIPKEVFEKYSH